MRGMMSFGAGSAMLAVGVGALLAACEEGTTDPRATTEVVLANHSATPALVKGLPAGVTAYSLIGSDDALSGSAGFVFGGSADGMGLLKNADGSFSLMVNHEDNFSVSRVTLDRTFKPTAGQYILTSDAGQFRLCSASLATPEEHGFGPVFLTVGESGVESRIHAVDPAGAPNSSRLLTALGAWSSENALPLPKQAYSGKTVILIGDDDSGTYGGQVVLYVGDQGDLDNGNLYVMARADENVRERDMAPGTRYPVVFRQIANQKTLAPAQFNPAAAALKAIPFGRVEDLDYRKGGPGREVYFNVTGQNNSGANADYGRTKYGRVYKLTLDAADPTRGTLEVVLDGDDRAGPARLFQNPDNILVTRNYAYIQEDPNGYGDETHDAYIYQYNLTTGELKVVMELDHRRTDAKYNVGGVSRLGSWEYGAMLDVSDQTGLDDTFLLAVQPHTWTGDRYRNPDGGSMRPSENQASQVLVIKGLPR